MKKVTFLAVAMIMITACKKITDPMVKIQVVEYKTNAPISGATLSFYKIGNFNLRCLCWSNDEFLTKQTDANGTCSISENDASRANDGMVVSKDNYFEIVSPTIKSKYVLEYIGQIQLHIIKINSHPDDAFMTVSAIDEGKSTIITSCSTLFPLPSDTTIIGTAFGGQTNIFEWRVLDHSGLSVLDSGFQQMDIPKTGIPGIDIKY